MNWMKLRYKEIKRLKGAKEKLFSAVQAGGSFFPRFDMEDFFAYKKIVKNEKVRKTKKK